MFFRMNTGSLFSDQWWLNDYWDDETPWFWRMMNPPPHFIERRILLNISCHDSKGTQHCGWCSNSTLPLPALSLFRGVQETGWPALICPTMCNYDQLCATMCNYVQRSFQSIGSPHTQFCTGVQSVQQTGWPPPLICPTRLPQLAVIILQRGSHVCNKYYATRETPLSRGW